MSDTKATRPTSPAGLNPRRGNPPGIKPPRSTGSGHPVQDWIARFRLEPVIAVVLVLAAWQLVSSVIDIAFLPPFSEVIVRLVEMTLEGQIAANLANSALNFGVGFGIALVGALIVGMAMGANKTVYSALDVYVNTLLTVPMLIFAPVFFTIFGLGSASIISVVVLYSMFIMIVVVADAVRNVDSQLIEMGRMLGASELQLYVIRFKAALPLMMAGFRVGAGRAVKGMINAEMFIAAVGLGAIVRSAGSRFDATSVLAVLMVIVGFAILVDQLMTAADRRFTSWVPSTRRV
jgi:ABC-type nitrate/sulfonate/bicarbonate transport system permease component